MNRLVFSFKRKHGGSHNENETYCHDVEWDGCIDGAEIKSKLIVHKKKRWGNVLVIGTLQISFYYAVIVISNIR